MAGQNVAPRLHMQMHIRAVVGEYSVMVRGIEAENIDQLVLHLSIHPGFNVFLMGVDRIAIRPVDHMPIEGFCQTAQ